MPQHLLYASARDQLAALRARQVSAVDLLDAHVARHEALKSKINAVTVTDLAQARADAAAIDHARAAGAKVGPLAGLPMTIKDCFDVNGMPSIAGDPSQLVRDKACDDAVVVARVKAAGAVVWGKTNVPYLLSDYQTFNSVYGTTNNPFDTSRTPAGSSGGAAAALACGITPLEIGSDIGGSLRTPANFCGVVSVKPTWGLIPCDGHVPPFPGARQNVDLNVCGPMARNTGDLRLLFEVLSAQPRASAFTGLIRAAVWDHEPGFPLARAVREATVRAATAVETAGGSVETAKLPFSGAALMHAYLRLLTGIIGSYDETAESQARSLRWLALVLGWTDTGVWSPWSVIKALSAPESERVEAQRQRDTMKAQMASFFETYDVLIAPITPVPPFPHDQKPISRRSLNVDGKSWLYASCLGWIAMCNALHLPSVAIQAGQTESGLPLGVQLIGPWHSEFKLLDIAERLEPILGGFKRPPV
jgi:amidase